MSSEIRHRPLTISITVTIALATAYFLYRSYSTSNESPQGGLHRSNAVRRPRRQHAEPNLNALHAQQSQEPNSLHRRRIDEAIAQLSHPSDDEVWAQYQNDTLLSGIDLTTLPPLELRPSDLGNIYSALSRIRPDLTESEQQSLLHHLLSMFVYEFIRKFFNEGHQFSAVSRRELSLALNSHDIPPDLTLRVLEGFSRGSPVVSSHWDPTDMYNEAPADGSISQADGIRDDPMSLDEPVRGAEDDEDSERGHNMLDLLYNIARKQADRHGNVHRGVECNSCGVCPIQGVRYHCSNCFDFDLCETREAKDVHPKTHVFLKIIVPAPQRGQIKKVVPSWYPGKPGAFPPMVPLALLDKLKRETGLDQPDIQGHYEQFKCLAGRHHPSDPAQLYTAMDRKEFEQYFIPSYLDRPSPANLIYERMFAFYDADNDGFIDFVEFVKGINRLDDKSFVARTWRIFRGHDLDGDRYVSRKDFLRMMRAYYDLTTQLNREMLYKNEEMDLSDDIRDVVQGNHPISSAFGGNNFPGHLSGAGLQKQRDHNGDLEIVQGPDGVLFDDVEMQSMRHRAIAMVPYEARERHPFRSFREPSPEDDVVMHAPSYRRAGEFLSITNAFDATEEELSGSDPPLQTYGWPPVVQPEPEDIISALGVNMPLDQIDDPVDRSRVIHAQSLRFDEEYANRRSNARRRAVYHRWERRQFYLDEEEGMSQTASYVEPDSSEDEPEPEPEAIDSSRGQSLRSRSSSKVRFDDSAIDTDYETRSNASSRSVPHNERWGGFELSRPTLDVGADVLYEAVQQGFNEMIDCIFKEKEDRAIEAQRSRKQRAIWEELLDDYAENRDLDEEKKAEALVQADSIRTEELLNADDGPQYEINVTGEVASLSELPTAVLHMQDEIKRVMNVVNNLSKDHHSDVEAVSFDDYQDPTLPQFRPDDSDDDGKTQKPEKGPKPSPRLLALWLKHRAIDAEAERRGGHGLLNLVEFRKAVEAALEEDNDERRDAGPAKGRKDQPNGDAMNGAADGAQDGPGSDVGEGVSEPPREWNKNLDLGKLSFLGTWLEMAHF